MEIIAQPLTKELFKPFGDVLECSGEPTMMINHNMCGRYHDMAKVDADDDGMHRAQAGISLFKSKIRTLPYQLDMMERHPLGSQAFIPMSEHPFLVIVAEDENNKPAYPQAFITKPGQGVNYHKNIWHGVLTPLHEPGLFAVIDRIGEGRNLEEFMFETPYQVVLK